MESNKLQLIIDDAMRMLTVMSATKFHQCKQKKLCCQVNEVTRWSQHE